MKSEKIHNRGFTLIELLVVVAIIAALAGISYPIILRQVNKGKEAEARSMMKDLETAIGAFASDNGMYPFRGTSTPETEELYKTSNFKWLWNTLEGTNGVATSTNHNNLKEKVYLQFKSAVGGRSGVTRNADNEVTKLFDPWGRIYYVCIDYSTDGEVDMSGIAATILSDDFPFKTEPFRGEVGVFNMGKEDVWGENSVLTTWR